MFGLEIIDIFVIIVYFLIIISIGFWAMRRIKSQEDYFLAGRRFGKFIQTFAAFGQGTSADTAIGVSTTTFSNGAAGMWSSLIYLFATPFYWLVMPWMRRLRLLTLGDFFEERYGSKMLAAVYAIIGSVGLMAILAVGFTALTRTVAALTPKSTSEMSVDEREEYNLAVEWDSLRHADFRELSGSQKERLAFLELRQPQKLHSRIDQNILIWIFVIVVIAYAVTGGLEAAFLTDTIQGVFIIVMSLILIPFSLDQISVRFGGQTMWDAFNIMHTQLSESLFEIFGSPFTIDFTWYYILAISFMGALNVVIQPNALIANGSAKNEHTARVGFVTGSFMKRLVTIFWGFFALTAILLYSAEINNPDYVWGYASLDLLGNLNIGLVGLMIACLLAAQMSTADCLMITCSGLLTHNIYRPLFADKSEKHYIAVGRLAGGLVIIGSALIATQFDSILQILKFMWEVNVMVAASFWLGMKWRRANALAAWMSIVLTAFLFFILPAVLPALWPALKEDTHLLKTTNPQPVQRVYQAKEADIKARNMEIKRWEAFSSEEKSVTSRPPVIKNGDRIEKTYTLPKKSIFWTKGLKPNQQGGSEGSGFLNLELLFVDYLGFDLTKNPYALNETIRIMIRTLVPFFLFVLVSLFVPLKDSEQVERFFIKMKVEVDTDPGRDRANLHQAYINPSLIKIKNLFPGSNWEFERWNREDWSGFLISVVIVILLIGFMSLLVSIGG
jgi:SSS family solute:Na+ symporter